MIQSIIDDVKNQMRDREHGCLSMASELALVAEIERLRQAAYGQVAIPTDGFSETPTRC